MILRGKPVVNGKPLLSYSPMHSPSNKKKSSCMIKSTKLSPKPSHRQNKENMQDKQIRIIRLKDDQSIKLLKSRQISQKKTKSTKPKLSITINTTNENKQPSNFCQNQTPKFKWEIDGINQCLQDKVSNSHQNYFSFAQEFRENIKKQKRPIPNNQFCQSNVKQDNSQSKTTMLKQRSQKIVYQQKQKQIYQQKQKQIYQQKQKQIYQQKQKIYQQKQNQSTVFTTKFSLNDQNKRQRINKTKLVEPTFFLIQKQAKQNKFKKDKNVFCFKK